MASRMSDERTSFVAFARHHVFVTLFGLVLPVVLFRRLYWLSDRLHDLFELL